MDFLGIGPFELILILILGLLFFGPEKLPGMAAKAARLYRNFRKSTYELTRTINEEVNTEIKDIIQQTSVSDLIRPSRALLKCDTSEATHALLEKINNHNQEN